MPYFQFKFGSLSAHVTEERRSAAAAWIPARLGVSFVKQSLDSNIVAVGAEPLADDTHRPDMTVWFPWTVVRGGFDRLTWQVLNGNESYVIEDQPRDRGKGYIDSGKPAETPMCSAVSSRPGRF